MLSPIVGMIGIIGSLYAVFELGGKGFSGYWDLPSAILLGVAPPSVMFLSHTIGEFFLGLKTLLASLFSRNKAHEREVIELLMVASRTVRSDGMGALIPFQKKAKYSLFREGLAMIINDFRPEEIRHNLQQRISTKQNDMLLAANLFENMSKVCPGIGMIGTLLGLIAMMASMDDPSKIGAGMALAMITTLYGILLGTILYAPMGEKIALEAEKSLKVDMMVLEGIMTIKGKKSSIHLRDVVNTYSTNKKTAAAATQQPSRKGA